MPTVKHHHTAALLQDWLATPLDALPQRMARADQTPTKDHDWFSLSCHLLALPGTAPLNSFTLHAPLELLARHRFMPHLAPADRPLARLQMLATALMSAQQRGCQAPAPADLPSPRPQRPGTPADTAQALSQALDAGDPDHAQALATVLCEDAEACDTPEWCLMLAPVVRDRMGAAAHLPIFLNLLARLHEADAGAALLARPLLPALVRELAQQPDARVAWPPAGTGLLPGTAGGPDALTPHLLALRPLPQPDASGIWPMVRQTLAAGRHLPLPGLVHTQAQQAMASACRVAAWSMLQEPLAKARYGWSHALTLPQAWWGLSQALPPDAELTRAHARLAALHMAAMRSVMGTVQLAASPPEPMPDTQIQEAFRDCARQACIRADAHAVKYVLACMDAAHTAPQDAPLYLAAAQKLCADWVASCPEHDILDQLVHR
jgi:hypothetical protein